MFKVRNFIGRDQVTHMTWSLPAPSATAPSDCGGKLEAAAHTGCSEGDASAAVVLTPYLCKAVTWEHSQLR